MSADLRDDAALEALVRSTLATRAGTIDAGPNWDDPIAGDVGPTEVIELGTWRKAPSRRLRPLLAAAAAAVVVATGLLAAVRSVDGDHGRPAVQRHRSTPTIIRHSCATTLPATWDETVAWAAGPADSATDWAIEGVTSDGSVVVAYDDPVGPSGRLTYRVDAFVAGSRQLRPLASFTSSSGGLGVTVDVDGATALVEVEEGIGNTERPTRIVAIDVPTGRNMSVARERPARGQRLVDSAYVLDGHAYWQTEDASGRGGREVHETVLSTGATRVVSTGNDDLRRSAAGVLWSSGARGIDRPGHLPALVAAQVTAATFDSVVTDGTSYAWQTASGALAWWGPGARGIVQVPGLLGEPYVLPAPGSVLWVAGPLVGYQAERTGEDRVLDTRTGASVEATSGYAVRGYHGTMIGSPFGGAQGRITAIDADPLPALRC